MKFALECDMVREEFGAQVFLRPDFLIRAAGPSRTHPSTHDATDDEKVDNIKPQIKCNCKKNIRQETGGCLTWGVIKQAFRPKS